MKITSKSHIDHGLRPQHIDYIEKHFGAQEAFFITTIELPLGLPAVQCALVGPLTGHKPVDATEVEFRHRGDRMHPSRMLTNAAREARGYNISAPTSRQLTVIGGIDTHTHTHSGGLDRCILFTAYGGPLAPREVGDPNITDAAELVKSFHFWREHALLELE